MADVTIQLDVTGNASQQLEKIQKDLAEIGTTATKVSGAMAGLTSIAGRFIGIMAGLQLGNYAVGMFKMADAITDMSAATGVSVEMIKSLREALVANGGDAESADMAITKLSKKLYDAATGSKEAAAQLKALGVSTQDIATGDTETALRKVVEGFAKMKDGAGKTALQVDIFGKKLNSVDMSGLNNQMDELIAKNRELTPTINDMGEIYDNMGKIAVQFGDEMLASSGGLISTLKELSANTKQIAADLAALTKILLIAGATWLYFTKILGPVTAALKFTGQIVSSSIFGWGMLVNRVGIATATFGTLAKVVSKLGSPFASIIMISKSLWSVLGGGSSVISKITFSLGGLIGIVSRLLSIGAKFLGWVGVFITVAQAVDFLVKKFFGFSIIDTYVMPMVDSLWAKLKAFAAWIGITSDKANKSKSTPVPTSDEMKKAFAKPEAKPTAKTEKIPIIKTDSGIDKAQEQAKKQSDALKQVKNSVLDVTKAYREQSGERMDQLNLDLKVMGMSQDQAELERNKISILQQQTAALKNLADKEIEINENTELSAVGRKKSLALVAEQRAAINQQTAEELAATDTTMKAIQQKNLALEKATYLMQLQQLAADNTKSLTDLQEQVSLVGLYGDALEDATLKLAAQDELQGKMLEYQKQILDLENRRGQIGEDRYAQEISHIQSLQAMAQQYYSARLAGEEKLVKAQRESARYDVKSALGKRMEEIARTIDPAVLAVQKMDSVFSNMGQAIDTFVTTGKFKFADFARSIILDLVKIQLKAAATQMFSSIFSSIFKIPGKATGGPVTGNSPYIVGEKGPELFIPNSSGSIVPNDKMQGGGSGAGGATHNTYITNNIQAVDAKSVAQLFIENRKTLLGATNMAKKEMPYA